MKFVVLLLLLLPNLACQNDKKKDPQFVGETDTQDQKSPFTQEECLSVEKIDQCLTARLKTYNVKAVSDQDFTKFDAKKVELGRLLFFDKILSGNNDMACATCHHPNGHTADRFTLSAGSGSTGHRELRRVQRFNQLVPRHTPSLFNRGHRSFQRLFWDGRVQVNGKKIDSPAKENLLVGLDSVLAAQAMFPPTSPVEMRGHSGENHIANLEEVPNIWTAIFQKVMGNASYRQQLLAANPNKKVEDLSFTDVANAIAAFESTAFRSTASPFDSYLSGEKTALAIDQKKGALLFYGKAACAKCHSGPFQTDHLFYNIGSPQFGPGKTDGELKNEDFGRFKVTKKEEDRLKFKTAPLRNVVLTPPYGRTGAFPTLESIIRHKINPVYSTHGDVIDNLQMPGWEFGFRQSEFLTTEKQLEIVKNHDLPKVSLSDEEIYQLIAFLESLTDPKMRDMSEVIPESVPSGLKVP